MMQTVEDILRIDDEPEKRKALISMTTVFVQSNNTVAINLDRDTVLSITIDKGLRLQCFRTGVFISVSASGQQCSIVHPRGRLVRDGPDLQMASRDWAINPDPMLTKHAKFTSRGIAFFSGIRRNFPFLLDTGGIRTHRTPFRDLFQGDITIESFENGSRFGDEVKDEVREMGDSSILSVNDEDRSATWEVNGVHVTRTSGGQVSVKKANLDLTVFLLQDRPGDVIMTNGGLYCTLSYNRKGHLFVKLDEQRLHYDGTLFQVRNKGFSVAVEGHNCINIY